MACNPFQQERERWALSGLGRPVVDAFPAPRLGDLSYSPEIGQ